MENNKPKFRVGDIVVIILYGTVGTITSIKEMNGLWIYEVNHSEALYLETTLKLLSEYEGRVIETEQIEIEYNYYFGDLVLVAGYEKELFKIIGIRTEIWRYKEDSWEEVIYELSRIKDGEWLEAGEEELTLLADHQNAEAFLQKISQLYLAKKETKSLEMHGMKKEFRKFEKERLHKKNERKQIIDGLLDVYNDYGYLYQMFKDEKYKDVMALALKNLEKITNSKWTD
ncbi:hypothetical protein PY093_02940 [Cytobacillus sp. S13-E01]|uniref:hypothetical protein n=1 Tax=Cytobacillus sp. S13-E01 TaxID=3031326 RepID=UPI0023D8586A|nr:hypothetical protein [Cytobacillus sp. S13-E01]MDF0725670.1 hypothetical protein [Cytobacillus sp. S13-E01]